MRDYRLFFLDEEGRVRRAIDLTCQDDEHAIRTVSEQVAGEAMQLWSGDRLLKEFLAEKRG